MLFFYNNFYLEDSSTNHDITSTGTLLHEFRRSLLTKARQMTSLVFSADSKYIACARLNQKIYIFRVLQKHLVEKHKSRLSKVFRTPLPLKTSFDCAVVAARDAGSRLKLVSFINRNDGQVGVVVADELSNVRIFVVEKFGMLAPCRDSLKVRSVMEDEDYVM